MNPPESDNGGGVVERIREFAGYLDRKFERVDDAFKREVDYDGRTRLKTERAEIAATRAAFRELFARELGESD